MKNSLSVALCCAIVVGCSGSSLEERRSDNPEARRLQKESLATAPPHPIAGKSVEEFFRDRVGLISNPERRIPAGRAAPVSPDGYYLTALHVVKDGEFVLSDEILLKPFPKMGSFRTADYLRTDYHEGRVVWQDQKADLALVKFDFAPKAPFPLRSTPLKVGDPVFAGASGTNSGALVFAREPAQGTGNGPFATAGVVTQARTSNNSLQLKSYYSTLVGRGGMSGAPVVDANGLLAGIITSLRSEALTGTTTTRFTLISPQMIREIIEKDRNGRDR
ncbi:S1 family peptidase [Roseibacillus persicicus]|uniref:S1 family peptidase n=1 Tax=Roseibacillus persicicus TaxID=454148 RepID=UPI00280D6B3C|nr:serine protease [Roseibacillus persicicus]MDQ8190766.1 serine protease [Roseibacillus persicicus]